MKVAGRASMWSLAIATILSANPVLANAGRWEAVEGNPHSNCLAAVQSVNIPAEYSIGASSDDGLVFWAITGDGRGLHVIACSSQFDQVIDNIETGPVRESLATAIKAGLVQATREIFSGAVQDKKISMDDVARYVSEIRQLNTSLESPLTDLLTYMRHRDKQFLKGGFRINMPVVD